MPTLGVDFSAKNLPSQLDNTTIRLHLWDLAGLSVPPPKLHKTGKLSTFRPGAIPLSFPGLFEGLSGRGRAV